MRIDSLGDEETARSELSKADLEQTNQIGRKKVLHELRREDGTDRSVGTLLELDKRVSAERVETLASNVVHHCWIDIDALGFDPRFVWQADQFAAAATEVDHWRRAAQDVDVTALPPTNQVLGTSEDLLESEVVVLGRSPTVFEADRILSIRA